MGSVQRKAKSPGPSMPWMLPGCGWGRPCLACPCLAEGMSPWVCQGVSSSPATHTSLLISQHWEMGTGGIHGICCPMPPQQKWWICPCVLSANGFRAVGVILDQTDIAMDQAQDRVTGHSCKTLITPTPALTLQPSQELPPAHLPGESITLSALGGTSPLASPVSVHPNLTLPCYPKSPAQFQGFITCVA